ncbi:MAG: hypothetical protein C4530_22455 [Desulfobacteraceae bacterium]|nr:MAG: hypothetical protein C4530_22455 [Desulfobacteraceae bacterium]
MTVKLAFLDAFFFPLSFKLAFATDPPEKIKLFYAFEAIPPYTDNVKKLGISSISIEGPAVTANAILRIF